MIIPTENNQSGKISLKIYTNLPFEISFMHNAGNQRNEDGPYQKIMSIELNFLKFTITLKDNMKERMTS